MIKMLLKALVLFGLFYLLATPLQAKQKNLSSDDYINLAAAMIQDGHFDRALLALNNVNLEDDSSDKIRYYTLQGLAYLSLNDLLLAKDSLNNAIKNGQQDQVIYVYLAQTHYGLKEYQKTIDSINKAGVAADPYASLIEMKAQSYWILEKKEHAINALNEGMTKFPNDYRFLRRKVFYFVDLKLYQEATELGKDYLELSQAKPKDYIALGNALRLSKEFSQAQNILESARLKYPEQTTLAKLLSYIYLDQGQINAAAFIMEQAALHDRELLSEATELYRRAGRFYKALSLNAGIQDQKTKLKQRMALLLALKRYERAANMKSSLYRTGLLDDQNIRYALAYAYFSIGRYKEVEEHLEFLKEPELFKKGIELRRVMNDCQEEVWKCVS